jgi:hypothetical protein
VAQTLTATAASVYVHEPDNWAQDPLAFLSQREVGRFPVLGGDVRAPAYDLVWRLAMRGGWPAVGAVAWARARASRLPRRLAIPALLTVARVAARRPPEHDVVVGKTVLGLGALEWLAARHADVVAIVHANPLNVLSSWHSLGWEPGYLDETWLDTHRPDLLERAGGWPQDRGGQIAVAVGTLCTLLDEAVARNPEWVSVSHEALCADPVGGFRSMFARLGVGFEASVEAFLAASDVPGEGLVTRRVTAHQPERWRRLPAGELTRSVELLGRFGLSTCGGAVPASAVHDQGLLPPAA